jgi:uncharacterized ferritin-like protein (DUF455 family)
MESGENILLRILNGGSLADKLAGSGVAFDEFFWRDGPSLGSGIPDVPARDGLLGDRSALDSGFPKLSELRVSQSARGRLLHYFANHELLAIETMALTLLKFPDAPEEFRRGLFRTLQDEQRHLRAYVTRMEAYGVGLGAVPLNLYFWESLKAVRTPLEFVAGMSLTFEQANLDFAYEFSRFFEQELSDDQTANLLREVHDDEVRHVGHGWKWFQKWKNPDAGSDYEAYQGSLTFPLTPRRARGTRLFSTDSRILAGLDPGFIREMKVAGGSRGQIPDLFWFNPACEWECSGGRVSAAMEQKIADFEPLVAWLGKEEDVILSANKPDLNFLEQVHAIRGILPEWVPEARHLGRVPMFKNFRPWGHSPESFRVAEALGPRFQAPPRFAQASLKDWYSKGYWKRMLGTPGAVIRTEEDLVSWIAQTVESSGCEWILKSESGLSGRGHQRVIAPTIEFLRNRLKRSGSFVIEPFYEKIADFSVQYEWTDTGELLQGQPRIFFTDPSGFSYRGSCLGSKGLPEESLLEKILSVEADWRPVHLRAAEVLRSGGFHGNFGIDCLWAKDEGKAGRVVPVIEVNVRNTMGRVAIEIERSLRKRFGRGDGYWCLVSGQDLLRAGASGFVEFEQKLKERFGSRLVATTPSSRAKSTWTFALLAERDAEQIRETLGSAFFGF